MHFSQENADHCMSGGTPESVIYKFYICLDCILFCYSYYISFFLIHEIYSISQETCTRLLLCFVVVIHWLIFPYPSGLLHWHCGNLTIAPVPAKQPWWIWINTLCEFIMNDCISTTKQSITKPCAYFLGYTVFPYIPHGHFTHWGHNVAVLLQATYHWRVQRKR